jgi:hypothetical protein
LAKDAAGTVRNRPKNEPGRALRKCGCREHYFAHKRWFFGVLLAQVVLSVAKELALYGRLLGRTNGEFHLIFALALIAGAITQREWFHKFLAPACCLLYLLYIVLLFARL